MFATCEPNSFLGIPGADYEAFTIARLVAQKLCWWCRRLATQTNGAPEEEDSVPLPTVTELRAAGSVSAAERLRRLTSQQRLRFIRSFLSHRIKTLKFCCFINARVPIVTFLDTRFGLSCDINSKSRCCLIRCSSLHILFALLQQSASCNLPLFI